MGVMSCSVQELYMAHCIRKPSHLQFSGCEFSFYIILYLSQFLEQSFGESRTAFLFRCCSLSCCLVLALVSSSLCKRQAEFYIISRLGCQNNPADPVLHKSVISIMMLSVIIRTRRYFHGIIQQKKRKAT